MKRTLTFSIATLIIALLTTAAAGAWQRGDLLRSDVMVRSPDMVNVYVFGATDRIKRCTVDGIPSKVQRYRYDKRVSLCSLSGKRAYRQIEAQKRVKVTVRYRNGALRSEYGKVRWDGVKP